MLLCFAVLTLAFLLEHQQSDVPNLFIEGAFHASAHHVLEPTMKLLRADDANIIDVLSVDALGASDIVDILCSSIWYDLQPDMRALHQF